MAVNVEELRIVKHPAAILRGKAKPIDVVTDEVRAVAMRMIALMNEEKGVGLAAPQVGLGWRMFVTKAPEDDAERVYVNPVLRLPAGERDRAEEGCLSIPGVHVEIDRPKVAIIEAVDIDGRAFQREASGYTARIWQHEFDHLNGVLIIDKMSALDKIANRKTLKAMESDA